MAGEAAEVVQTEKSFDIAQGKFVDKPIDKEVTPSSETAKLTQKAADYKPPAETKPAEEKPAEEKKPEEVKPTDEEKPAETKPAEEAKPATETKPAEEKKPETQPEQKFEPGSYIKGLWGEKFGLESEKDVQEVLEATDELTAKYNDLLKEHEALKTAPKFDSEHKEKIAKFLEPYPADKFTEALSTAAEIIGMTPENISGFKAMKEAFILTKPHLTRDEAGEMFEDQYHEKYNIDRADFDSDEGFNKKKRSIELQLKDAEAEAKKVLVAKQAELKAKPVEKKEEKPAAEAKPVEVPKETVAVYQKEIEKFLNPEKNKVWDRIPFMSEDGKETMYTLVLDQEKLKDVRTFMENFVRNPAMYSKDGKITNFDPQDLAKIALRVVHGDWIERQLLGAAKVIAERMKAEQIASTSPEKKSTGTGDIIPTIDEQFRNLAKEEEAKRQKR